MATWIPTAAVARPDPASGPAPTRDAAGGARREDASSGRRLRIGVLPFAAPAEHRALGGEAARILESTFHATGRIELVPEENLREVLAEIAASNRLGISQEHVIEAGRLAAAQYMCFGEVQRVQINSPPFYPVILDLAIRLVDVETGEVVFEKNTNERGETLDALFATAIRDLGCHLTKSIVLAGHVLAESGSRDVLLDWGRSSGIAVRDKVVVLRMEAGVPHPTTGRIVRRPPRRVAELRVVEVGTTSSVARVVSSSEAPKAGDLVRSPARIRCRLWHE